MTGKFCLRTKACRSRALELGSSPPLRDESVEAAHKFIFARVIKDKALAKLNENEKRNHILGNFGSQSEFISRFFIKPKRGRLAYASVGFEHEVESGLRCFPKRDFLKYIAQAKGDGSLRDGTEFCTQPAAGLELVSSVQSVCRMLNNAFWGTSVRTGGHIHVSFSDTRVKTVYNFMCLIRALQPLMFLSVPERRRANRYALDINWHSLGQIGSTLKVVDFFKTYCGRKNERIEDITDILGTDRYRWINMTCHNRQGTVEFRLFEESLDPKECIGRGLFLAGLVEAASFSKDSDFREDMFGLRDKLNSTHGIKPVRMSELPSIRFYDKNLCDHFMEFYGRMRKTVPSWRLLEKLMKEGTAKFPLKAKVK